MRVQRKVSVIVVGVWGEWRFAALSDLKAVYGSPEKFSGRWE